LKETHKGHQGETKCIRRTVDAVWWPGMTADIRSLVKGCSKGEKFQLKPREPLVCSSWPGRPWWRLAVDLCTKDEQTYLVVVDYYSRYITVNELTDSSNNKNIVSKLETLFCLLGIPNILVSDNGPQFVSDRFQSFPSKWDVKHITSSPKYPQSNSEAERAVQTVKGLMKKNVNIQAACVHTETHSWPMGTHQLSLCLVGP